MRCFTPSPQRRTNAGRQTASASWRATSTSGTLRRYSWPDRLTTLHHIPASMFSVNRWRVPRLCFPGLPCLLATIAAQPTLRPPSGFPRWFCLDLPSRLSGVRGAPNRKSSSPRKACSPFPFRVSSRHWNVCAFYKRPTREFIGQGLQRRSERRPPSLSTFKFSPVPPKASPAIPRHGPVAALCPALLPCPDRVCVAHGGGGHLARPSGHPDSGGL